MTARIAYLTGLTSGGGHAMLRPPHRPFAAPDFPDAEPGFAEELTVRGDGYETPRPVPAGDGPAGRQLPGNSRRAAVEPGLAEGDDDPWPATGSVAPTARQAPLPGPVAGASEPGAPEPGAAASLPDQPDRAQAITGDATGEITSGDAGRHLAPDRTRLGVARSETAPARSGTAHGRAGVASDRSGSDRSGSDRAGSNRASRAAAAGEYPADGPGAVTVGHAVSGSLPGADLARTGPPTAGQGPMPQTTGELRPEQPRPARDGVGVRGGLRGGSPGSASPGADASASFPSARSSGAVAKAPSRLLTGPVAAGLVAAGPAPAASLPGDAAEPSPRFPAAQIPAAQRPAAQPPGAPAAASPRFPAEGHRPQGQLLPVFRDQPVSAAGLAGGLPAGRGEALASAPAPALSVGTIEVTLLAPRRAPAPARPAAREPAQPPQRLSRGLGRRFGQGQM